MALCTTLSPKLLKTTQEFIDELRAIGIDTVERLLLYFPRSYEDLSQTVRILDAPLDQKVTIRGIVSELKLVRTRSRKVFVQARCTDDQGTSAQLIWFNQPHILRMLKEGQAVSLTGKITENGYKITMQSPAFEDALRTQQLHAGRIVAVYPQTDKISSRWLREKMVLVRECIADLHETLPPSILHDESLISRKEAVEELHFPTTPERLQRAQERVAFEEMLTVQTAAIERKRSWQGTGQRRLQVPMDIELMKAFFACQSFTPTGAQKVAIYEILKDMEKDRAMSRLLEGDVGSGKTLVAVAVIANVLAHRGQCALMVPTEVLARQHLATVTRLLLTLHTYIQSGTWVSKKIDIAHLRSMPLPRVGLLTGSLSSGDAMAVRRDIASGSIDVAIGTHALIEDAVGFRDLKLVIIDEQHRFGVAQRDRLAAKGFPHVLAMTATPIPRTLALTAYGDHDLSVLLEKPGHRRKIITKVVSPTGRRTVELFIDQHIQSGRQAYVICPLIAESAADEMQEVRSVETEAKRLSAAFPQRRIAALHGQLSPEEKGSVMRAFKEHQYDILVSTSVIEVGIDVPNTTIIVIEGAERFGLSQLHQFRGRVGRSDEQSYCYLFTTTLAQARSERLKAMEEHDSGFMLAEIDLKLRGPGELYGLRQSGIPELRFADVMNVELIVRARRAAEKIMDK